MQHSGSSTRTDNWTGAIRNKTNVNMSPSALTSIVDRSNSAPAAANVERVDSSCVFIATSPAMREVRRQIEKVAAIDVPILIMGESGTGKEVVVRMIHKLSNRATKPLIHANCSALAADLLERDLFGHQAGAFESAAQSGAGKFEIADDGTLLLDDVGGMPLSVQPKLLHLLQKGEFAQVGGNTTSQCNVRVLAAANPDLPRAVEEGTFRPDLYYRLNAFTIQLPPLRDRREDLPHLLNFFVGAWAERYGQQPLAITRRILDACTAYSWPGNVRELENFVKRYLILGEEDAAVDQIHIGSPAAEVDPALSDESVGNEVCDLKSVVRGLKQGAEKAAILQALERTRGNKQEAAALLHISLRALHYKVRAYGIESASLRVHECVDFSEAPARSGTADSKTLAVRTNTPSGKVLTMARTAVR